MRKLEGERLSDWLVAPEPPPKGWFQRRGYALERMIAQVLSNEGLEPKTHIRPSGEEIDGSFLFSERLFHFEAKWKSDPVPASDFYAFKGKVDGKLVGTIGIFISMSGFSPDAVDALSLGKEINLILFNGSDFQLIAEGHLSFVAALRKKLRYAAEEGRPFLPLSAGPDAVATPAPNSTALVDETFPTGSQEASLVNVVVEGAADQEALQILLARVEPGWAETIRVWPAGGRLNVASLTRQLRSAGANGLAVVVESDMPMDQLTEVSNVLSAIGGHLLIVTPSLEEELEGACSVDYLNAIPPSGSKLKMARRVARNADLDRLLARNRQFGYFFDWLRGKTHRDTSQREFT